MTLPLFFPAFLEAPPLEALPPPAPVFSWTRPREGLWRYHRVDYATRHELEELATIISGGTISRNIDSELKEQGTLPCVAPPVIGDDLIRIYYVMTDDQGAEYSLALATMHAVKSSAQYTAAAQTSTLNLYSALLTLQQSALQRSLTIAAGSVAVTEAVSICTTLALPVVASASTRALTTDASWDAGTSYLKIVNYLLDCAGFWSARVDGYGRVVMGAYEAPKDRAATWEFVSGPDCVFVPEVSLESDAFNTPNVCVLNCSNPAGVVTGSYTNADPASPYSTQTRGREIVLVETVTDAIDEDDLNTRAEKRLVAATAVTERVGIKHSFVPVTAGDVVKLTWGTHGLSMLASVQSQDISLTPAGPTTASLKRVWQ